MPRLLLSLLAAFALTAPAAHADTFAPPPGQVYTGLSGGTSSQPYTSQIGKDARAGPGLPPPIK